MGDDLYTSVQKYRCFWLEKWGRLIHESTYTRENTVCYFGRIKELITYYKISKMNYIFLPSCLKGNYGDNLGEFSNT